jgi:biopolymer transport protein ExbB
MKGNIDAARSLCKASGSPSAIMIDKGISRLGKSTKESESAMESVGKVEISKLERNTNILGVIAGIAPMFGFIGTISGVIKIFYNISLADNISIGLISGGLYEKMITSAAGWVVGVFSFICYHYLQASIDKVSFTMEKSALEFMDIINE